jgi:hypothetical protein
MGARLQFAQDVLVASGIPPTQQNLLIMVAWWARESSTAGKSTDQTGYNPGNISHDVPGAPSMGQTQFGTRIYPTWDAGVTAYARQFNESRYRPIAALMRAPDSPAKLGAVSAAIIASGYASAGYSLASFIGGNTDPSRYDGNLRDPNGGIITTRNGPPISSALIPGGSATGAANAQLAGFSLNPLSGLDKLAGAAIHGVEWMANPHNWLRIILGGVAVGALGLGVVFISKDLAPGVYDAAEGAAKSAVKAGELAAAA